MSERSSSLPRPEGEYFESARFSGLSLLVGGVALVSLILCLVGAYVEPEQFAFSWLFAFAVFFTLCAGCFFWTIVHHATDAEWSVVVRRLLESIGLLMPALAVLFIPALLLRHHLFGWMSTPVGHDAVLDSKRAYLNWNFFLVRAVFTFAFFSIAAWFLRRYSVDYVAIGPRERFEHDANDAWWDDHGTLLFERGEYRIYGVEDDG